MIRGMRRHPLHSQNGTHCRQLRPKRRHPSCTAHVGAGDCTQPRLNPSKQRLERSCEGREKVVRGSRATDEQRGGAQARDGTVIAWRGEGAMRAPPDELADVQRCAESPLLMLHRLRLCPTRAERRRVRGRTRARARDCSSRASWELCSRALTARAAGACLFPGWKTGAESARPRLPGQGVAVSAYRRQTTSASGQAPLHGRALANEPA